METILNTFPEVKDPEELVELPVVYRDFSRHYLHRRTGEIYSRYLRGRGWYLSTPAGLQQIRTDNHVHLANGVWTFEGPERDPVAQRLPVPVEQPRELAPRETFTPVYLSLEMKANEGGGHFCLEREPLSLSELKNLPIFYSGCQVKNYSPSDFTYLGISYRDYQCEIKGDVSLPSSSVLVTFGRCQPHPSGIVPEEMEVFQVLGKRVPVYGWKQTEARRWEVFFLNGQTGTLSYATEEYDAKLQIEWSCGTEQFTYTLSLADLTGSYNFLVYENPQHPAGKKVADFLPEPDKWREHPVQARKETWERFWKSGGTSGRTLHWVTREVNLDLDDEYHTGGEEEDA